MKGKVKWFSHQKGYGFIVGEDSVDRFFGVSYVKGADLPNNGDEVEFEPFQGKKGPAAKNVTIHKVAQVSKTKFDDQRVECPKCGKRCVPRLWHEKGDNLTNRLTKHICPFCGVVMYTTGGGFNILAKVGAILIIIMLIQGALN